jgi:hypothetical protein
MVYKEVLKRTAFFLACFLITVASISTFSLAHAQEITDSCRSANGKFYINNEYYKVCSIYGCSNEVLNTITSYNSSIACNNAAIEKYGCIPSLDNRIFYGNGGEQNYGVNFSTNTISLADAKACLTNIAKGSNRQDNTLGTSSYCSTTTKFFQCKCSTTLLGEAGTLGSIVSWTTGSATYNCYLKPVTAPQLVAMPTINPQSPMALIKITVDTLFYMAVILFFANFLRVGLLYIRSDGVPDQLKKARNLLYSTISGMIFFMLVSGLLIFTNNAMGF